MVNDAFIVASGEAVFQADDIINVDTGQSFIPGTGGIDGLARGSKIGSLISFNATFGLNLTPNQFTFQYATEDIDNIQLPAIDLPVELTIKEFYVKGRVINSDIQTGSNGKTINITVQDLREDLNKYVIDTFGIYEDSTAAPSNLIDVKAVQFEKLEGGGVLSAKSLDLFSREGATYREIYNALPSVVQDQVPDPDVIEKQIGGDPDAFRFQARAQPLLEFMNKLLSDSALDFYWSMKESKIKIINRKSDQTVDFNTHFLISDTSNTITSRLGNSKGERPTQSLVYGGQMEGFIGNGAGSLTTSSFPYGDLGVNISLPTFIPGWRNATIRYFKADGFSAEDSPTDREMAGALKGIEFWAFEKNMDNRIAQSTTRRGSNTQRGFSPTGASGINFIPNRPADEQQSWVVDWYNRVRNFALNNFGRFYYAPGLQVSDYRKFDSISEAWTGIENSPNGGGSFEDGYIIDDNFRFAAPFWNHQTNKLKAFAVIPDRPKWGIDGNNIPAQFSEYVEDGNFSYVPIEVIHWKSPVNRFTDNTLAPFRFTAGVGIRLPNVCWQNHTTEDDKLKQSPVLNVLKKRAEGDTAFDLINPLVLGTILPTVSNVGLPIKVRRRYGVSFPATWQAGSGTDLKVDVREELVPWNFEPRGNQTSTDLLNIEGTAIANSLVVNRNEVTFAELEKVGLPVISFDNFADEDGKIKHGITSLQLNINDSGYKTRYSIKSHFPQLIKLKPIQDKINEDFAFTLKRLKAQIPDLTTTIRSERARFTAPPVFEPQVVDGNSLFVGNTGSRKLEIPVIITKVDNRGSTTLDEFYTGREITRDIIWPRGADQAVKSSATTINSKYAEATAIDGFFQVGMLGVYHYEEQDDGFFEHYFTGGVPLEAGKIVELTSDIRRIADIYVANIKTLATQVSNPFDSSAPPQTVDSFRLSNVPFADQANVDQSLVSGDKILFASHGNKNKLSPESDLGPTGANNGDGFLYNTASPSAGDVDFAYVTVRPASDGKGGAIKTIDNVGGTIFKDEQTIDGVKYIIEFVGTEARGVEIGDFCFVRRFREKADSSGEIPAFRLYCAPVKPTFQGGAATAG